MVPPEGIGWGVIGCGDVVDRKAGAALRTIPGSRIVTVMRRSADEAQRFAQRHGVAHWTTDADAVIAHPAVNAIYVATPPEHHLEYALRVCAAGKPCLVEKPAGRSATECRQMVDVFRQAGVPLYVSYYRRHLAKFRKVKEIVDEGRLGTIVAIDYRMAKPYRGSRWRTDPKASGGGRFYDLAGHVLDLFDDWFGPLESFGGVASNTIPLEQTEDAVALTFRTPAGAVGTASFNFAAATPLDDLCIEGTLGSLRLAAMSRGGPIRMTITPDAAVRASRSIGERVLTVVKRRAKLPTRTTYRFREEDPPHRPMLERIVSELAAGSEVASAEPPSPAAALRTATIMNAALDEYYGGRDDAFWSQPERWKSLRNRSARRLRESTGYRLTAEQIDSFRTNGYLGPLRCDGDWRRMLVPLKKGRNLHLTERSVFDVCSHPSIVEPVAQLIGEPRVALFKSRFIVKVNGSNGTVAWHQDVGPTNGGYFPDGAPVPTLTCWLALDRVGALNGAVKVVPGTHTKLFGEYHKRIRANLVARGDIESVDLASAVTLALEPGEFYLFHSWLLHASEANTTRGRRAGVNMRYASPAHRFEPTAEYIVL